MVIANFGFFNNLHFPILDIAPLFPTMWEQSPWQTILIFSNKSIFSLGQADMRSGLYLWTLEFDLNSLAVYFLAAGLAAWLFMKLPNNHAENRAIHKWTIVSLCLLLFSRTYITVLAHCAGPTWIGYVSLYALGMDEVELTSLWQWLMALVAISVLLIPLRKVYADRGNF